MGSHFLSSHLYNKDPLVIVKSMDSYYKRIPPDCGLFSADGYEIPLHKELLFQTKLMCQMLKNVDIDCCKISIMCPSLTKKDLEKIVDFLYGGKIYCTNMTDATQVFNNLTQLFGFPSRNFEFNGTILKSEFEESDVAVSNYHSVSNLNYYILRVFICTFKIKHT